MTPIEREDARAREVQKLTDLRDHTAGLLARLEARAHHRIPGDPALQVRARRLITEIERQLAGIASTHWIQ